jgi:uncharacterized membrane protein YbhN (UPF0104 family)
LAGIGVQESVLALLLQQFQVPLSRGTSIAFEYRFFYTVVDIIGVPPILKFGVDKILNRKY